jgi:hypothetical protein
VLNFEISPRAAAACIIGWIISAIFQGLLYIALPMVFGIPETPFSDKRVRTSGKIRINNMPSAKFATLRFKNQTVSANFIETDGQMVQRPIEIRTNPIPGRTSRIAFSRINEKGAAADSLPQPPPDATDRSQCPFCRPRLASKSRNVYAHFNFLSISPSSKFFPNLRINILNIIPTC